VLSNHGPYQMKKSQVSQEKEELHRKSQEPGGTRVPQDEKEPGSPRRRRKQGSPGGGEMLGFSLNRSSQSPTRMKKNQGCQGGKTSVVCQEEEKPGSSGRKKSQGPSEEREVMVPKGKKSQGRQGRRITRVPKWAEVSEKEGVPGFQRRKKSWAIQRGRRSRVPKEEPPWRQRRSRVANEEEELGYHRRKKIHAGWVSKKEEQPECLKRKSHGLQKEEPRYPWKQEEETGYSRRKKSQGNQKGRRARVFKEEEEPR
jgi:hypothetical protein